MATAEKQQKQVNLIMIHSFIILSGGGQPMTKEDAPMVFLFGLLFFIVGLVPVIYYLNVYFNRVQTFAEVTDFDTTIDGPIEMYLKFINFDNILIEARVNVSSDKRIRFTSPIGSKIPIFYHKTSNKNVVLKDKIWGNIIFFGLFILMGLTVIFFAVSKMNS